MVADENKDIRRIKLVVAYDGTNYCGWQLQLNGRTIEAELNDALADLFGEPIAVIGASRTDSGVHAMGNVAVFDTSSRMPADKICYALNQRLPEDIRIQESVQVPDRWHPHKCRSTKTYEYRILNRRIDMPVFRQYAHFCYTPLDTGKMQAAAAYLIGEHNFKSFCSTGSQIADMVRTIYHLDVKQQGELITIRISGSGFLYNMVRIIAGTLIEVGKGFYEPQAVEAILMARDRKAAGPTALPRGLTLIKIDYQEGLEPWYCRENWEWKYQILQSHIQTDKKAYFLIERCLEAEWGGLLERNIHQAVRDGAESVYLIDFEKKRLRGGDIYGYYRLTECPDADAVTGGWSEDEAALLQYLLNSAQQPMDPSWYCALKL